MQKYGKFTVEGTFDIKEDGTNTWVSHPSLGEDMWFMLSKTNVFEQVEVAHSFEDGDILISTSGNTLWKRSRGGWIHTSTDDIAWIRSNFTTDTNVSRWINSGELQRV